MPFKRREDNDDFLMVKVICSLQCFLGKTTWGLEGLLGGIM